MAYTNAIREASVSSERLAREVAYAARLHRRTMPEALPGIEGYRFAHFYRPSGPLGGDLYDFVSSRTDLRILLADVSGHGISAALCTMLVKSVFRRAAEEHDSPVGVLTAMNRRLQRDLPEGMFVAAGVLSVAPNEGSILFANAGLPYPHILQSVEGTTKSVVSAGHPLGLFSDPEMTCYASTKLELVEGDVLLLATDGLAAALGDPEELEDARLAEFLRACSDVDGTNLVRRLASCIPGCPVDDVSFIAATRGPVAAKRLARAAVTGSSRGEAER